MTDKVAVVHYIPGCSNRRRNVTDLRAVLDAAGRAKVEVRVQAIEHVEDAERAGFVGSPTVLLDGSDPFFRPGAVAGVACRLCLTEAGPAGSPSWAQLRAAVDSAWPEDQAP